MNPRVAQLTSLILLGSLAACGSAPASHDSSEPVSRFNPAKDPYWQDPKWDKTMLDSVQAVVHDPADPAEMAAPGLQATVKFTYFDGTVEYPEIVQSTGKPDLDKLMLQQLASAQVPQPTAGLQIDTPHEFVVDLDMPTPLDTFRSSVYYAIENWKVYPKEDVIRATTGDTTVDFDYLDGKTSAITVAKSSNDKGLDEAAIGAVTRATFLPTPPEYSGKSLHMEVVFCYTMIDSPYNGKVIALNPCPTSRNVIVVQGSRMRWGGA